MRGLTSTAWTLGVAVLCAATAATATEGLAQEPTEAGVVRGRVVDADDARPLGGATVTLELEPPSSLPSGAAFDGATPARTTVTDDEGRYRFSRVPSGRYHVTVSRIGYGGASVWIELPASWEIQRSVALVVAPVALAPLEIEVDGAFGYTGVGETLAASVEDSRPPHPLRAYHARPSLDARSLRPEALDGARGLGEPDVLRALQGLPGVSARGDWSATLWTRGAPWGMTQILLDGLPLYDPLHLGGISTGLAADGLGLITMQPGVRPPSEAIGAAGTVTLRSRPASDGLSGSVGVSPLALRAHVEDRVWEDRLGVVVSARRSWWDVVDPPSVAPGDESDGPIDFRFADARAFVDLRVDDATRVSMGGLWEEDRLHGDIPGLVTSSSGSWGNVLGWAAVDRRMGPAHVRAMVGDVRYMAHTRPLPWASFRERDGVPALGLLDTEIGYSTARIEVSGALRGRSLTWGAGLESVEESLWQFGPDAQDRRLPGVFDTAELARRRGWVEGTATVGEISVAGGLSWDGSDDDVPGLGVLPSMRIRWAPASRVVLEAATGLSRQFAYPLAAAGPSLGPALGVGHLWILAGDGREALRARTSTVAAEVRLPRGFTAQINLWRRRVDGLWIDGVRTLEHGVITPAGDGEETGSEQGRGLEVSLARSEGRLRGELGYSLGASRFAGGADRTWPSPAHRRHSLDAAASAGITDDLRVGASFTAESGWPLVTGWSQNCTPDDHSCVAVSDGTPPADEWSLARAPVYASLDISARWETRTGPVTWELSGSLRNALGRDNAAAYRAGTCGGGALISIACATATGIGRFSPGLTRPTPSAALRLRF